MSANDYRGRHYALLVEDLESSVARIRETFALEFMAPARIPFTVAGQGREFEQEVRACYALNRSIELVEAAGEGPVSAHLGFGLHHYGVVVPDLEAATQQQAMLGNEVEWRLSYEGRLVAVLFKGYAGLPGRLELVTAHAPPLLEIFAEAS